MSDSNHDNNDVNDPGTTKANTGNNSVSEEIITLSPSGNINEDTKLTISSPYNNTSAENPNTKLGDVKTDNNSDLEKPLLENKALNPDGENNNHNNNGPYPSLTDLQDKNKTEDEYEYENIQQRNFRIVEKNLCKSNINPISQYNYLISISNISYCRGETEKFWKIPFCDCLGSLYDLYILFIKKFAYLAGCLCSKACKWCSKIPETEHYVETNRYGSRRYFSETSCNICYLAGTIIIVAILFWVFLYSLIIVFLPHALFMLYNFVGLMIHLRNKSHSKQKSLFFDNMILDETLPEDSLDQCICVSSSEHLQSFKDQPFYENLRELYTRRNDESKPQKFVIYGKKFSTLHSGLCYYFGYQIIFSILFGAMIFGFNQVVGTRKQL